MNTPPPRRPGRQKRPRVPDALRKRAARACLPCRQHKEKCHGGGPPCARCQQHNRTCHFEDARPKPSAMLAAPSQREIQMERIIRHFLGDDISLDPARLEETADLLENGRYRGTPPETRGKGDEDQTSESYSLEPLSTNTMHYSGELSHWNFSKMIRRRLQSLGTPKGQNDGLNPSDGFFRATGLQSASSCVASAIEYFPPRPVAEFLTNTFLEYAQTNYFYFPEIVFREKMDYYYSVDRPLVIDDAGWICTLLMTFAIGTQFAYMQTSSTEKPPFSEDIPDDRIGMDLYRFSCRLIPDLITTASLETVQAFLLLGVYTLPIDTAGLAYTYYGLAIKMAIQNGMHRKHISPTIPQVIVEWRNRLWWTAYSLESRISILHGRPVSVSPSETDADMPADLAELRPPSGISNLPNVTAAILLTKKLEKVAQVILRLRRCPRSHQDTYLHQLYNLRADLSKWWDSLPNTVHCRDLDPAGPLFRCNVHLELHYATALIYMGRPFIFLQKAADSVGYGSETEGSRAESIEKFSQNCTQAAIRIIDLCQLLHDSVGLARVSYTEFSSCRTALLALIAQLLTGSSEPIGGALTRGMGLIRQICVGLESARSEVAVIEALERARQQLDHGERSPLGEAPETGYDQFQKWAKLWRLGPLGSEAFPSPGGVESPNNPGSIPSFDGFFSSFPQELDAFAAIPGSEDTAAPPSIWPVSDAFLSIPDNTGAEWGLGGP
ncbi:transcriptional regulator family: Fungal Specific TF [Aspergillus niger]|nr:transcriptional regulator family: Fungal Specific TF [Aspergillus niger]KAI2919293.1 transcriptional regulator family: Fungal Specific TF [Aspergillus niger]KAI2927465.1 transcriptional regulator family: Fungal Specific TF [Aspergillus niger]KAI2932533.1 transcriptional regulator family: Fungal Specific TF [Aspergillus niger]KAI2939559.1 transcriptional regulator family: Fungal Specific TF [Aspergillus niger]